MVYRRAGFRAGRIFVCSQYPERYRVQAGREATHSRGVGQGRLPALCDCRVAERADRGRFELGR